MRYSGIIDRVVVVFWISIAFLFNDICVAKTVPECNTCNGVAETKAVETCKNEGLYSFFANIEIPKFTLQDAVKNEKCSFFGFEITRGDNPIIYEIYFDLYFKSDADEISITGATDYNDFSCVVSDNRIIAREVYEDLIFLEAPTENLAYFNYGDGFEKALWIEESLWEKIQQSTPEIKYSSKDGTILKMKYYRFPDSEDFIAFGEVKFENASKGFWKRWINLLEFEESGSKTFEKCVWNFQMKSDKEIEFIVNLGQDYIVSPAMHWSQDKITFPAITEKGLKEVVFIRQK